MTGKISWTYPDQSPEDAVDVLQAFDRGNEIYLECEYDKLSDGRPCIYCISINTLTKFGTFRHEENKKGKIKDITIDRTSSTLKISGNGIEDKYEQRMQIELSA